MRIIFRLKILFLAVILSSSTILLFSQVKVERSKDKVIISGVAYYIHQVKKGETAYSISKAYGITVEDLDRENPPAVYGINEGQSLRIPVRLVTDIKQPEEPVKKEHDDAHYIYHDLKPGETVYSLSKSFGVSENEIIQSNPGMDINKLSVGTEIAVPKRQFMSSQQKFDTQENKYIYHKVLQGETLSSIARQYGLSVRQLRRENRDIGFPQVGDFIRIPGVKAAEVPEPAVARTDTMTKPEEILPVKQIRTGFTDIKNLSGSLNVAVLLPFYIPENSSRTAIDSSKIVKGKRIYKSTQVTDDWIYPQSLDFVEMYEGILLACDTLRKLGLNLNLHTFDVSDTSEVARLISSGKLAGSDLIIGPVYSQNMVQVSAYAARLRIPVVSPVPLMNNSALIKNPTAFMSSASVEVAQRALAKKIGEYYDNNIVFIHADTLDIDEDVKRFKSLIFKEMSYKIPYEDIKFKEFKFYSRSMFNNDSINRLGHALSEKSNNVVIIASEDPAVISEVIDNISGLARRFNVKLFGYPVIRELDRLDSKELFDMDLMVFSPLWIDYNKKNVKQFNAAFREKFLTEPLERSYAWQGFDIAYFFLSGLAMNGKDFISHPENHYPELLQTEFDFKRISEGDGFENQKLYMIRYTKNYELILEGDSLRVK